MAAMSSFDLPMYVPACLPAMSVCVYAYVRACVRASLYVHVRHYEGDVYLRTHSLWFSPTRLNALRVTLNLS